MASSQQKHSVFKLPPDITSFDTNAFKPYVMSFGPYHYNEQHLKHKEAHKHRSLKNFLNISDKTLPNLLQSLEPMKQQLMDHYPQLDYNKWRDGDCFLELMTRDGCFMLDMLRSKTRYASEYSANDPVFGQRPEWNFMCQAIKRDMLLIENQLPLLVLEKLIADNEAVLQKLKDTNIEDWNKVEEAEITEEEFIHKQLHELISEFFGLYPMNIQNHNVLCLHVLDVYRENWIWGPIHRPGTATSAKLPAATALHYTGVTFIQNHTASLMDITFENGFLTLPCIEVANESKTLFLNLMAFERFQTGKFKEVSAYIDFMDSLVRSIKDVSLLRSMDIIRSSIESDKEIVAFFHKLAKNKIVDPDDSLDEVRGKLLDHYEENFRRGRWKHWNERLAEWGINFKHTYCKTPWTVIGLVAGITLLALNFTQTTYTVLPYYRKH